MAKFKKIEGPCIITMINTDNVKQLEGGHFYNGRSVTRIIMGDENETYYDAWGSLEEVGEQLSD